MKTIYFKTLLTLISVTSIQAFALDIKSSIVAGLRSNESQITNESYQLGVKGKSDITLHAYYISEMKLNPSFLFRTGGGVAMRDAKATYDDYDALPGFQNVTVTVTRLFFDIPLTFAYQAEAFEMYAGANIAFKLSSSIDVSPTIVGSSTGAEIKDEKGFVVIPTLGANYSITKSTAIGAFYEFETNYSKNWNQSAYGINLAWLL